MVGYVTTAPAFVRSKLEAQDASSFYDFWISPFWLKKNFKFADVLDKEYESLSLSKYDHF